MNIRGIKSKTRSLDEIIQEENPTLIAIAETWLEEKEEIKLEGYKIIPKNINERGRGILIAIKKELENITSVVMEEENPAEQLWIKISNERINIRVGLIYAPQESRTKLPELAEMYKKIEKQIETGKNNKEKTLVIGDLNCKIGEKIKGNTEQISKGGKLLIKLAEKNNMEIINTTEVCEGTWTRDENGKKSVLDYALINKEEIESVKKMYIDEKKEITPFTESEAKKVYSDHNTIILEMDWILTSKTQNTPRTCMTEEAKATFKEKTNNTKLMEIWKGEGTTQEKYTEWNRQTIEITNEIFITKRKKKKHKNKRERQYRKKRKHLKQRMKETKSKENRNILNERRKLLLEFIYELKKKQEMTKITEMANKIKAEGGFDANAFWKHREMMMGRKKEIATAIKTETGEIEEDPEKIKEIYRSFYQKLLKDREPDDEEEKQLQENKEKCIKLIEESSKTKEIQPITREEYDKMKQQLKKKKAPDKEAWRYEWIIHAGKDLDESIFHMLNEIRKDKIPPTEWRYMAIKSISKNIRKKMEMAYKRGLFLTNILSKCTERILLNRRQDKIENSMKPFQCGGTRERSIADNHFITNCVIAEFRKRKENLYILFMDLEKCFDKLYLKDCIIELVEAGMPTEEAIFIYKMNKDITAEVITPHGTTDTFTIDEAVRQGTIWGTTLCGLSTNRINKMGEPDPLILYNKICIGVPIYVDDMIGLGSAKRIENIGNKMSGLERTKKFEFNNKTDKTEVMVIKNSQTEEVKEVKVEVRKGKIGETVLYKSLGDHYNGGGRNEVKIKKKMEKARYMACNVKRMGNFHNVGKADLNVRMLLLETTVKPSLLANVETWCDITTAEEELVTKHHHETLCITFGLKRSTPYYGIIGETGIWPYIHVITYKKLMLLHHFIHSYILMIHESQNKWL